MANKLRIDNSKFYIATGITADENSKSINVGGAESYSMLVTLADNGSGAGSIALEGSLDDTNFVELSGSSQTIAFVSLAQKMLFTVQKPSYKYVRVAVTVSAGDIDVTSEVTVTEGTI